MSNVTHIPFSLRIGALKTGQFTQDYILDELNRIKTEREANLKRLDELKKAKAYLANLEKAEVQLNKFYSIAERIDQCTPEEKRLAFEGLGMKVKATPELVEISVIPVDITPMRLSEVLLTIEQTSGSVFRCRHSYIEGRGYALSIAYTT